MAVGRQIEKTKRRLRWDPNQNPDPALLMLVNKNVILRVLTLAGGRQSWSQASETLR